MVSLSKMVTKCLQGGYYVLDLTAQQYNSMKSSFTGIDVKPTTGSGGKMTFRLTEPQWQQFQANQAKAASGQGSQSESSSEPGQISVSRDSSECVCQATYKCGGCGITLSTVFRLCSHFQSFSAQFCTIVGIQLFFSVGVFY